MILGNDVGSTKSAVFDAFAGVIKALANGHRLELLELMAQGEHSVDTLARMARMAVTTTSAHLQSLKKSGLVKTRRERSTIYYSLAGDDVAELYVAAKRVALSHSPQLRDAVVAYMSQPVSLAPTIDPSAVTSTMTVVDVRPRQEYEAGHFPGAVSIPLDNLPDRFSELPQDGELVVYCRGEFCRMAREAATWLRAQGLDAKAMDEGIVEWRAAGECDLDQTA